MQIDETIIEEGAARFGLDVGALDIEAPRPGADGLLGRYAREGKDLFIKFMAVDEGAIPAICEKYAFILYLRENGVSVLDVYPALNGEAVAIIQQDGRTYAVSASSRAPGETQPPEAWDEILYASWGRILGQTHALTKRYTGGDHIGNWRDEHEGFAEMCSGDAELRAAWLRIGERVAELPTLPDAYGLVHNDANPWNFVTDGETTTLLDFDVMNRHWFAYDLAIPALHAVWMKGGRKRASQRAFFKRFWQAFYGAYAEENVLDTTWIEHLPLFARYRRGLFTIVFSQEGGQDAGMKRWLAGIRRAVITDAPIAGIE